MADRRRGLVFGEAGRSDFDEFREFREWAIRKFGEEIANSFRFGDYKNTPQYDLFIREGESGRAAGLRAETFPRDIGEAGQLGFSPEAFAQQVQEQAQQPTAPQQAQEIVELGGFTYLKNTAPDGSVNYTPVGRTPEEDTGEVSPDVAANLAFQRERLGFEQAATEQNRINALRAQFGGQAAQRAIFGAGAKERDIEGRIQAALADQFERTRRALMQSGPRGLFVNQLLRQATNPFTPSPETALDTKNQIEEDLKAAETSLGTVLKRATDVTRRAQDPDDPLTVSGIANPSTREEFKAQALFTERRERGEKVDRLREALNKAEDESAKVFATGEAEFDRPSRPQAIKIPRELSEFLPEGLGGRFVTPSAQAFGRLSFTGRERLLGAVEVRGEQPTDILEDIQRPLSPRKRGGRVAPISFV